MGSASRPVSQQEPERAPVTLFYLRQYRQAEVAAFLEIPESTVNNRMHSARKHLKKELHSPTPDTTFAGRVQEQIEAMTSLHAALAEPIRQSLVETLGDNTSVHVVAVENTIGLHVLRDFPHPCCTYSFQPKGSQRRICFDIHMELAACIVGRTIGRGDEIRVVDVGQIGRDEFNVISPVAGRLMREIVALWSEVVDMDIVEPEIETSNFYVMDTWIASDDPMFHIRFEVTWDDRVSHINLCYPAPSLAAGLAQLQAKS